jgi:hypothetical protein
LKYSWKKGATVLTDGVNIGGSGFYRRWRTCRWGCGTYSVVVSNANSQVTSPNAVLGVAFAPSIVTPPGGQTVKAGSAVTFTAGVVGSTLLSYQWQRGSNT